MHSAIKGIVMENKKFKKRIEFSLFKILLTLILLILLATLAGADNPCTPEVCASGACTHVHTPTMSPSIIYYDTAVSCTGDAYLGRAAAYGTNLSITLDGTTVDSTAETGSDIGCIPLFCNWPCGEKSSSLLSLLWSGTKHAGQTVNCEIWSAVACSAFAWPPIGFAVTTPCVVSKVVSSYQTDVTPSTAPATVYYQETATFECDYRYRYDTDLPGTYPNKVGLSGIGSSCNAIIDSGAPIGMAWDAGSEKFLYSTNTLSTGSHTFKCDCSSTDNDYAAANKQTNFNILPRRTQVTPEVSPPSAIEGIPITFTCDYTDIVGLGASPPPHSGPKISGATCTLYFEDVEGTGLYSSHATTESGGFYSYQMLAPAGSHRWYCGCSKTSYETKQSILMLYSTKPRDYASGVCFGYLFCNVKYPTIYGLQSHSKDDPAEETPTKYPLNGSPNLNASSLMIFPFNQSGSAFLTLIGLNETLANIVGSADLAGELQAGPPATFVPPGSAQVVPGDPRNRRYSEIVAVSGSGKLGDIFNVTTDYQVIIELYNITGNSSNIAEFVKYPLVNLRLDRVPLRVSADRDHDVNNNTVITIVGTDLAGNLVSDTVTLPKPYTAGTQMPLPAGISFDNLYIIQVTGAIPGETVSLSTALREVSRTPIPLTKEEVTSKEVIAQVLPDPRRLEIVSNVSGFSGTIVGTYRDTTPVVENFVTGGNSHTTMQNFTNILKVFITGTTPYQFFEIRTAPLSTQPNDPVGAIRVLPREFTETMYMNKSGTYLFGSMDKFTLDIPDNLTLGPHNFTYLFIDRFNNTFVVPYEIYLRLPTALVTSVEASRDLNDANLTHITFKGILLYTRLDEPTLKPSHPAAGENVTIYVNNITEIYAVDNSPPAPPYHQYGFLMNLTTNDTGEFNGTFDIRGWGRFYLISLFNGTKTLAPSLSIKPFYGGGIAVVFGNPQIALPIILVLLSIFLRKGLRRAK